MWYHGEFYIYGDNGEVYVFDYSVKSCENGSRFGIDNGCILKLDILDQFTGDQLVEYNRDWIQEPNNEIERKALDRLLAKFN